MTSRNADDGAAMRHTGQLRDEPVSPPPPPNEAAAEVEGLKPCPFCGAKRGDRAGPLQFNDMDGQMEKPWHVYCWSCTAQGPSALNEGVAIEAWNQRNTRPANAPVEGLDFDGLALIARLRSYLADIPQRWDTHPDACNLIDDAADALAARASRPTPEAEVEAVARALWVSDGGLARVWDDLVAWRGDAPSSAPGREHVGACYRRARAILALPRTIGDREDQGSSRADIAVSEGDTPAQSPAGEG